MADVYGNAIEAVKLASRMSMEYYGHPMTLCYSGGKDSDALVKLAIESGEPFVAVHNHTTADAPETVMHIRRKFHKLEEHGIEAHVLYPEYKGSPVTMWSLIPQKLMPPTRIVRYCCSVLKERPITDSVALLGVRARESRQRSTRKCFEVIGKSKKEGQGWNLDAATEVYGEAHELPEIYDCNLISAMKQNKATVANPLIDWSERDVLDYLEGEEMNPLYAEGFGRVGCIGCPMASKGRYREFARWPKYHRAYVRAFDKMVAERLRRGKTTQWIDGEEVMHWWMEDGVIPGQMELELL